MTFNHIINRRLPTAMIMLLRARDRMAPCIVSASHYSVLSSSSSSANDYNHNDRHNRNRNSLLRIDTSSPLNNRPPIRSMRLWKEKVLREFYWRSRRFDAAPEKQRARSDWQEWNYSAEIYAFAQRLGERDGLTESGLTRAFTHRSYVSAQRAQQAELGIADVQIDLQDNSELIAEGRRLIERHAKRYFRYHLRAAPEECIEAIADHLLSAPILGDIAKWIGCIDMIYCAEFPPSIETLADTVAAVIATIAAECGEKRAYNFITDFIFTYVHGTDILEIWPLHELDLDLNRYLLDVRREPKCEARILHRSARGTIESCYVVGLYQPRFENDDDEPRLIGSGAGESPSIANRMAQLDAFRRFFALTIADVRLRFGAKAYDLDLQPFERENFYLLKGVGSVQNDDDDNQHINQTRATQN